MLRKIILRFLSTTFPNDPHFLSLHTYCLAFTTYLCKESIKWFSILLLIKLRVFFLKFFFSSHLLDKQVCTMSCTGKVRAKRTADSFPLKQQINNHSSTSWILNRCQSSWDKNYLDSQKIASWYRVAATHTHTHE